MKLNLGCGEDVRSGFANLDVRELPGVTFADVSNAEHMSTYKGVRYILAQDVLEHFPRGETKRILEIWVNLLAPDGVIDIQVPDVRYAATLDRSDDWYIRFMYGGQEYPENFHKAGFTKATLTNLLTELGLTIESARHNENGNLFVRARKCS